MRSAESFKFPIAILTAVLSVPAAAMAQNADTDAQAVARANAAIAERYMVAVPTELTSKVDSKTAAVGLEVTARTLEPAKLADGTSLPRDTKLVGHVLRVQAESKDQPFALLAITFDRAELKDGSKVALRSLIRMVAPPARVPADDRAFAPAGSRGGSSPMGGGVMNGGGMGGGGMGGGGMGGGGMGGGGMRPAGSIGSSGSTSTGTRGGTTPGGGGLGDGESDGGLGGSLPTQTTRTVGQRTGTTLGGMTTVTGPAGGANMPVTKAGETTSTAPRATALPGVMLSTATGDASVSGVLMASGQNISLSNGTQITLGVISNQPRPAP